MLVDEGAVSVSVTRLAPEKTAPQLEVVGDAASVRAFSRPVVTPYFIVRDAIVLLVKTEAVGKVITKVWFAEIPVGVVNLRRWLEVAEIVSFDIVSDMAVREAAFATVAPSPLPTRAAKTKTATNFARGEFLREIIVKMDYCKELRVCPLLY